MPQGQRDRCAQSPVPRRKRTSKQPVLTARAAAQVSFVYERLYHLPIIFFPRLRPGLLHPGGGKKSDSPAKGSRGKAKYSVEQRTEPCLQGREIGRHGLINIVHPQRLVLVGGHVAEAGDGSPRNLGVGKAQLIGQALDELADVDDRHADGALSHFIPAEILQGAAADHILSDGDLVDELCDDNTVSTLHRLGSSCRSR